MAQVNRAKDLSDKTTPLVGRLRTDLTLVLQTRHSQLLVRGRNTMGKPPIPGLLGFSDRLRLIWHAAGENDPYADWWLVKIQDSLAAIEARIATESHKLEELMKTGRTLRLAPAEVKEPFRMKLEFSTPYAYRAARTLGDFDELVCLLFTAKHLGMLTDEKVHDIIRGCARRIRAIFLLPLHFKRLGITRQDFIKGDLVCQRAKDLMGILPTDISNGSRRAMFAPPIQSDQTRNLPTSTDVVGEDRLVFE